MVPPGGALVRRRLVPPPAKHPVIYFQVSSYDEWDRYRCEGYGRLNLGALPVGSRTEVIKTWKAGGTIADRVASQFVGGSPEIGDVSYAGVPADAKDKPVHSRLGFVADSSGEIKVRVNIVTQTKADASAAAKKGLGLLKNLLGKGPGGKGGDAGGAISAGDGSRRRRLSRTSCLARGLDSRRRGRRTGKPGRGAEGHAAVQEGGGGEAGAGASGALRLRRRRRAGLRGSRVQRRARSGGCRGAGASEGLGGIRGTRVGTESAPGRPRRPSPSRPSRSPRRRLPTWRRRRPPSRGRRRESIDDDGTVSSLGPDGRGW